MAVGVPGDSKGSGEMGALVRVKRLVRGIQKEAELMAKRLSPAFIVPDETAFPEIPHEELLRAAVRLDFPRAKVRVTASSSGQVAVSLTLELWEAGYCATEVLVGDVDVWVALNRCCLKILQNRDLTEAVKRVIELRLSTVHETPGGHHSAGPAGVGPI